MTIQDIIKERTSEAMRDLFGAEVAAEDVQIQETRKEFSGDFTVVIFPLTKFSKKSPIETAEIIGKYLDENLPEVVGFEVVKGFLNLTLSTGFWLGTLNALSEKNGEIWQIKTVPQRIMLEYSSPNTNKPLHLGHVRNNLLGFSVAEILKARGNTVIKANLVNDKGVHISKSMLAWMKFGHGETPESSGIKGDHLVGKYYVLFDKELKKQIEELVNQGKTKEEAEKNAAILEDAQALYRKWEKSDEETLRIWKMMNGWVYSGFNQTYKKLGVDFDVFQYESETYVLGKEIVHEGLANGAFIKKDGAVFADLTDEGLDQKALMRSDGTSIYITQDLGTAQERFDKYELDRLIYTVGNEQDYHFKALKLLFKKLGRKWWNNVYHLSYGMVDLPSGKMKSREGTVVDADDLIDETISEAEKQTRELGKLEGLNEVEQKELFRKIGMAGLKFYILKVDPQKRMLFNPQESIDLQGFTGPFVQYTYARIKSILRKHGAEDEFPIHLMQLTEYNLKAEERELLQLLYARNAKLEDAENELSPALIANYAYDLAKTYNKFYHECPVLNEQNEAIRDFRLCLSQQTARVISANLALLGIEVPEKM